MPFCVILALLFRQAMNYHSQSIAQVLAGLQTQESGLTSKEAEKRLGKHGKNALPRSHDPMSRMKIFVSQWKSPLLIILLIAGTVSGVLGEVLDMTIIYITAFVNACIGFFQEDKANQALKKLREMVEYKAVVLRNGAKVQIASEDIVLGDILYIEAGDKIQADGRLIQAHDLHIAEATLTGESEPVLKKISMSKDDAPLGDRLSMVYRGTEVRSGRGMVAVSATGMQTEIGKIATLVKETKEEQTPLQLQLSRLGRLLGGVVVSIAVALFIFGLVVRKGHYTVLELFQTSVAVAVAAIPEGLVISLTVILAIGMQYILKRNALVRRLVATETLGSVSVICTDKTGTITEGNMRVTRLITASDDLNFGELKLVDIKQEERHRDAVLALRIGVLCNDAAVTNPSAQEKEWKCIGEATEVALVYAGMQAGVEKSALEKVMARRGELPFTSTAKYMATLHSLDHETLIYVKGAPEIVFGRATEYEEQGAIKKLSDSKRAWFEATVGRLTDEGLRVLALAYRVKKDETELRDDDIDGLTLVGIVGISDPVREGVKETLAVAEKAGIHVVMITGDHVRTAHALARAVGLTSQKDEIINGMMLGSMNDEELRQAVKKAHVFARVDAEHKIRIVQAFRANGEVVAMTGDGVNDAPALKGADVGVALGSGTDVAKETSDLVLLDDSFVTIVAAVEEGRRIYQNIKKVVLYLLAGSFGEVILIGGSILMGFPLPVLPAHILWVNIIEDSLPNIGLAFDKGEKENMSDAPRAKHTPLIDAPMKVMIGIISIVSNVVLLGLFIYFWKTTGDIALSRTLMFIGLGIDSLLYVYSVRSMRRHIWQMNPFNNHQLNSTLLIGWGMLVAAVYVPFLQTLLRTVPISWQYWGIMLVFGMVNVVLIELIKSVFLGRNKAISSQP